MAATFNAHHRITISCPPTTTTIKVSFLSFASVAASSWTMFKSVAKTTTTCQIRKLLNLQINCKLKFRRRIYTRRFITAIPAISLISPRSTAPSPHPIWPSDEHWSAYIAEHLPVPTMQTSSTYTPPTLLLLYLPFVVSWQYQSEAFGWIGRPSLRKTTATQQQLLQSTKWKVSPISASSACYSSTTLLCN